MRAGSVVRQVPDGLAIAQAALDFAPFPNPCDLGCSARASITEATFTGGTGTYTAAGCD